MITAQELVHDLRCVGVAGRHVMVHSSWRVLRPVEDGIPAVLDAFVEATDSGVLLFPTFCFESFSERGYWDRDNSPSRMGAISEAARVDKRFHRSSHPMLSFAVHDTKHIRLDNGSVVPGAYREHLEDYGFSIPNAHGIGSVFDKLIQNDGILLSFSGKGFREGLDVGFTASVHAFVEAGVDWRVMKLFRGVYVDGGVASIREYAASVTKEPKRYQTQVTLGHVEAEKQGIIRRHKLGRTECIVANAREFHAFAVESCMKRPELWRAEVA